MIGSSLVGVPTVRTHQHGADYTPMRHWFAGSLARLAHHSYKVGRGHNARQATMSYTVEQLIWAIRLGRVNATKETGAALILSAAEQMQLAPLQLSARGISL